MKIEDVLLQKTEGEYNGYVPQGIYELSSQPFAWEKLKKLPQIPKKISHFFDVSKIVEVRRTNFLDPLDNSYFLQLKDSTYIEIVY